MNTFVETSIYRRIRLIVDIAIDMEENAAIIGASGVGKSRALQAYNSDQVNIARIQLDKDLSRSLQKMLFEICEAIGVRVWPGESIRDMTRSIERHHLWDWVVIIDEAQMLPLDILRELLNFSPSDGGQLRFVFCGNEDVLKQINTDRGALAQISRRIKYRETILGIDDGDADVLTNSFGGEGRDVYELMRSIGRSHHADGVVTVLKRAAREAEGSVIKMPHVRQALQMLEQYRPHPEAKSKRRKAG